jgi:signal transduction histidine kinase
VLVAGICCLYGCTLAAMIGMDRLFVHLGRPDLVGLRDESWVLVAGLVSAGVVGAVLAVDQPRHPVGWLFLALSGAMLFSGAVDYYASYALRFRPGSLPVASGSAVLGDKSFIPWLVLVALVLYLTPDGRALGPGWRLAARVTVLAGVSSFAFGLMSSSPLSPPYQHVHNPWRIAAVQPVIDAVAAWSIAVVGLGLITGGISLLVRYRSGTREERRPLLWLALVVIPLPLYVVAAFVASRLEHPAVTIVATAGFVVLVPIAAGLSVSRYHLYDVERVLTASTTYVLLTLALVLTYGLVVLVGAHGAQSWSSTPVLSATVGALAAAALAAPLRSAIQQQLDQRFNRRAYDARRIVGAGLADQSADVDVERLLRHALCDDSIVIAYPGPGEDAWVTATGESAEDAVAEVDVHRHDRLVARVAFDPARTDAATVRAASALAVVELDNGRLRAQLARQVSELRASRLRLATTQRQERRRIERDLHDGAQQSLLALAFDLQSSQLSGDEGRMKLALSEGAETARQAVRELRALANGLHPAALADGGLSAALDDLSRHSPVTMTVAADVPRLDPALEFTAWLVLAEAAVNAQKHAQATALQVTVAVVDRQLRLSVADNGCGGANGEGPGLRGLRDRVDAAGGTMTITSTPAGTTIGAVLPCGS